MVKRRGRDEPHFFGLFAADRERVDGPPPLADARALVVSEDARTGAGTYLVEAPDGWRYEADGREASVEFFVLKGDLGCEGDSVGPSGYIHVPQNTGGGEIHSGGGCLALLFWEPSLPSFPPPYTRNRVTRLRDLPYHDMPRGAWSHGMKHKSLRVPDPSGDGYEGGPGGFLRFMVLLPGERSPFQENHHECFEEMIILQGDILLADEGEMGLGSVFVHPQEWWHGPYVSRFGAAGLVHTDAPMGSPFGMRDYPYQDELCNMYLDEADWGIQGKHATWDETPWRRVQDTAEFRAWQASGPPAWGDKVGRGSISGFRSSWRRSAGSG